MLFFASEEIHRHLRVRQPFNFHPQRTRQEELDRQ